MMLESLDRPTSAPWTKEDGDIAQRGGRSAWAISRRVIGLVADIRDADLYLRVRQFRLKGCKGAVEATYRIGPKNVTFEFGGNLP